MALALGLALVGCTTNSRQTTAEAPAPIPKSLNSLLGIVPFEIQTWGERDMTVYSFNPEIRDELFQAIIDAGFYEVSSEKRTRDWNMDIGVLTWCVTPDPERREHELQFSAVGKTAMEVYRFKPKPDFNVTADNDSPLGSLSINSLVRIAPYEIWTWGDGSANDPRRDMTAFFLILESETNYSGR